MRQTGRPRNRRVSFRRDIWQRELCNGHAVYYKCLNRGLKHRRLNHARGSCYSNRAKLRLQVWSASMSDTRRAGFIKARWRRVGQSTLERDWTEGNQESKEREREQVRNASSGRGSTCRRDRRPLRVDNAPHLLSRNFGIISPAWLSSIIS